MPLAAQLDAGCIGFGQAGAFAAGGLHGKGQAAESLHLGLQRGARVGGEGVGLAALAQLALDQPVGQVVHQLGAAAGEGPALLAAVGQ